MPSTTNANYSSPEHGIRLLLQLLLAGRRSKRPFRPVFAAFLTIFCIGAFTIAGGFSSSISIAIGNKVLLKSINYRYKSGHARRQNTEQRRKLCPTMLFE